MAVVKRIVCLANSRKLSGRCVAGKGWAAAGPGPWIRPVSDRPTEEVSEHERQYQDGSDPQVLDIVRVPLLEPRPKTFQSENWLLDPHSYWVREGTLHASRLDELADHPPTLWANGHHTGAGVNDRVPQALADTLDSSLYLLQVDRLDLQVSAPGAFFGNTKRRVQGSFTHGGVPYAFWVTDPAIEREFKAKSDGVYPMGPCFITVSLGEPHEGYCYKLIAAVIREQ